MIRCIDFGNQLKPGGKPRFGFYEIEKDEMFFMGGDWYWTSFEQFEDRFKFYERALENSSDKYIVKKLKYYFDRCPAWAK